MRTNKVDSIHSLVGKSTFQMIFLTCVRHQRIIHFKFNYSWTSFAPKSQFCFPTKISDEKIVHVRPPSRDLNDSAGQRHPDRPLGEVSGIGIDFQEKRIRILSRTRRRRSDLRATSSRSLPDRVPRQAPLGIRRRRSRVSSELWNSSFKVCKSYFNSSGDLHQILFVNSNKIVLDPSKNCDIIDIINNWHWN